MIPLEVFQCMVKQKQQQQKKQKEDNDLEKVGGVSLGLYWADLNRFAGSDSDAMLELTGFTS